MYFEDKLRDKYPYYDDEKIEVIMYGLEGLYLTFTKLVVILGLGLILGKITKILMLLLFYNIIRFSAFGLHANKSYQCLIMSLTLFVGGVYVCDYIYIPLIIKVILSILSIVLISLYAPADTEKRPLINRRKRIRCKIISIISSLIYTILIIKYNNDIISNYLLVGLIESTIMILPLSYKTLNLPYCNYKRYKFSSV